MGLAKYAVAYLAAVVIGYLVSHAYTEYHLKKFDRSDQLAKILESGAVYRSRLTDLENELKDASSLDLCSKSRKKDSQSSLQQTNKSRKSQTRDPRFKYTQDAFIEKVMSEDEYLKFAESKPKLDFARISTLVDCVLRIPSSELCSTLLLEALRSAIVEMDTIINYGNVIVHNIIAHNSFDSHILPGFSASLVTSRRYTEAVGLVDHAIERAADGKADVEVLGLYKIDAWACLGYPNEDETSYNNVYKRLGQAWRSYERQPVTIRNVWTWSQIAENPQSATDFSVSKIYPAGKSYSVIQDVGKALIQPYEWLQWPDRDMYLVEFRDAFIEAPNFLRYSSGLVTQSYHRLFSGLQNIHNQSPLELFNFEQSSSILLGGWINHHPLSVISMLTRLYIFSTYGYQTSSAILIEQDSQVFRNLAAYFGVKDDQIFVIPKNAAFTIPLARAIVWPDIPNLPSKLVHQYIPPIGVLPYLHQHFVGLENYQRNPGPPFLITLMVHNDDLTSWLKSILNFATIRSIDDRTNPKQIPAMVMNSHVIIVHRSSYAPYLLWAGKGSTVVYFSEGCRANDGFISNLAAALEWNFYSHPNYREHITTISDFLKKHLEKEED